MSRKISYKGHTYAGIRNLTTLEQAIDNRAYSIVYEPLFKEINESFDHTEFYSAAGQVNNVYDLYLLDEKYLVIPCSGGIFKYDDKAVLKENNLTYTTQCCGKFTIHSGRGYICSRCKRQVTSTGYIKYIGEKDCLEGHK